MSLRPNDAAERSEGTCQGHQHWRGCALTRGGVAASCGGAGEAKPQELHTLRAVINNKNER